MATEVIEAIYCRSNCRVVDAFSNICTHHEVCTFILPKYSKGFHKYIPDGGTALATGHTAGNKSRDTTTVELSFLSYHIASTCAQL